MTDTPPITAAPREGSLEAPFRHPIAWRDPDFYDLAKVETEMERVFEICHGCRRCFNLCNSFPTLFDLVDESKTGDLDAVDKKDYWKVVDHCYLCDMCYMTKCPYVPPHPWNVDFPHLMLRAKAQKHERGETPASARLLSSTRTVGKFASIPIVVEAVNWGNNNPTLRKVMEKTLDVHRDADVPAYHSRTARKRLKHL